MRTFLLPSLLLVLTGCATTESQFQGDFPAKFCAFAVPCINDAAPGASADTADVTESSCTTEMTDYVDTLNSDEGCTFDSDAAEKCLAAVDAAASCGDAENVRDECEGVFSGDSCDLHLDAFL